jgi:hypothetical protein
MGGKDLELVPEEERGTSVFGRSGDKYGTTVYYPFSISGNISQSTSFSVQGKTFAIQSYAFIVADLTTLNAKDFNVSAAVPSTISCADVAAAISVPITQQGTLAPKIVERKLVLGETGNRIDGYSICSGSTSLEQKPRGMVTVSISQNHNIIDTLLVSGEATGW